MKREEQIEKAAERYMKGIVTPLPASIKTAFIKGAEWTDEHPTTEWLDKACEWLEDKLPLYWSQNNADNTDRFIRLFKKYMEEQQ